jgi:hypothetical protein
MPVHHTSGLNRLFPGVANGTEQRLSGAGLGNGLWGATLGPCAGSQGLTQELRLRMIELGRKLLWAKLFARDLQVRRPANSSQPAA